jgi:hypothetical protein
LAGEKRTGGELREKSEVARKKMNMRDLESLLGSEGNIFKYVNCLLLLLGFFFLDTEFGCIWYVRMQLSGSATDNLLLLVICLVFHFQNWSFSAFLLLKIALIFFCSFFVCTFQIGAELLNEIVKCLVAQ